MIFDKDNTDASKFPLRGAGRFLYCLHLADSALILAQRNSEWCAHAPVLEQDIAITNISLDLLGQARNFYQYAATIYNDFSSSKKEEVNEWMPRTWKTFERELKEDDLAFLRQEQQYLNLLICELPKGDWALTILRQFFFSAYQHLLYGQLKNSSDIQLAAIATKSLKEAMYHLRWSSEWVVRLGEGTEESHQRIQIAANELWPFKGEFFTPALYEQEFLSGFDIKEKWLQQVTEIFTEASLSVPKAAWMQHGGKEGRHTENLGFLLAEMQYMQRTYPDNVW